MTFQRDHGRSGGPGQGRSQPGARRGNAVLGLQRTAGNRATGQVLARKKNQGTLEHSVRIGKGGAIEITGGNITEWASGKTPDDLVVTSAPGKHSSELKRLSESRERIGTVEAHAVVGQNSWVVIRFRNARIRGYAVDGKTEKWVVTDFDEVNRERTSIGKHRP